jgi:hypothetical protein
MELGVRGVEAVEGVGNLALELCEGGVHCVELIGAEFIGAGSRYTAYGCDG